jgi:hypothetical protein
MREYVPIFIFVVALIFSAGAAVVFGRFGARALWVTALLEACLGMVLLWSVGWAQTSESPLVISILMVGVAAAGIAATVQAVGRRRPVISALLASVVGLISAYVGVFAGYVLYVYTA